ncbi:MAG: hypothetical protein AB7O38_02090 [Pirellulaceae bacterium]
MRKYDGSQFEMLRRNHPHMQQSGFAMLANIKGLDVPSFELADGMMARRATDCEIDSLHNILDLLRPYDSMRPIRNPYETAAQHVNVTASGYSTQVDELPIAEWRYYVISFDYRGSTDGYVASSELIDWSVLSRQRLFSDLTIYNNGFGAPTFPYNSGALDRRWREMNYTDEYFANLTLCNLQDIRHVYEKMTCYSFERIDLRAAVHSISQLDKLPRFSPMRFLGYMAILESILTHPPKQGDPYDSITRQVRQKMLLVSRRAVLEVPNQLLGIADGKKTWNDMYEYRSIIAHGGKADFKRRLASLKNSGLALKFLEGATVSVLRQALEEPELIADLRDC